MSKVLVYGCSSEADGNGRKRRPCEVKKDDFQSPLGVFATEPLIWQFNLLNRIK